MTKIVCTIGPASESEDMLRKLVKAGMNVARLNFSHGTHKQHRTVIKRIRKVASELETPVSVLQDLPGPKIRIGDIENGSLDLEYGQEFTLTTRDVPGTAEEVSVNYEKLPERVKKGDTILLSDGQIELRVEGVSGKDIVTKVLIGGPLSPRKGINLPTSSIDMPAFTYRDRRDLSFGIENGVDIAALSFVQSARDVDDVRKFIKRKKTDIPVIAKIEKHEALENIDKILEIVDGIMVARGDLGVEIPLEQVPIEQKVLINKAGRAGKIVITATQMLKSMVDNARPTRAEAADVTNAILDGTDAIMLSEETAVGNYPDRAVTIMSKISRYTISSAPFTGLIKRVRSAAPSEKSDSVCLAACNIADNINAGAIVVFTDSGTTAGHISRYRPRQPIIALTPRSVTCRRLGLLWGVNPVLISRKSYGAKSLDRNMLDQIPESLVTSGDTIVVTDEKGLRISEIR